MKPESIEIIPYQESWQAQFKQSKALLKKLFDGICIDINHIGSTAVLGLASKNKLDIQIGVKNISAGLCQEINARIESLDFTQAYLRKDHLPPFEIDSNEWQKIYLKADDVADGHSANIHFRKVGAKNYEYALMFRDYLRYHPETAEAYARVKQTLAKHMLLNKKAYCEIKDPVCDLIMINAREWVENRGCSQQLPML